MGRYVGRILNYHLEMGDYVFDYVKENQPLEYYQNYKINTTLTTWDENKNETEEPIEIPLLKFGKPKLKIKKYRFDINWDFSLHKILYDILVSRKIPIVGEIYLVASGKDRYTSIKYYLQGDIGTDNVQLSNYYHYKKYPIMSYDDFIWMWNNGLNLE